MRFYMVVAFLVLLFFALLNSPMVCANDKASPSWLKYIMAGKKTAKAKQFQLSQKYYLSALSELESLVGNECLKPTDLELGWLSEFPHLINEPFRRNPYARKAPETKEVNVISDDPDKLEEAVKILPDRKPSKPKMIDGKIVFSRPTFNRKTNPTYLFMKSKFLRLSRVYRTYYKLLGPNNKATKLTYKLYEEKRKELEYYGTARMYPSPPPRRIHSILKGRQGSRYRVVR